MARFISYRLVECQHVWVVKPLAQTRGAQDNAADVWQRRNVVQFLDSFVQLLQIATVFSSSIHHVYQAQKTTYLRDDAKGEEPALRISAYILDILIQ